MSFSFNHSLDDDSSLGSSKRLSWGSVLKGLHHQRLHNQRLSGDQEGSSGSETGSVADVSLEEESSLFCHPLEETLAAEVVEAIAHSLQGDHHRVAGCSKLLYPACLLQNIGHQLLHLAASEPCGLRGALIDLCVEQGGLMCRVDQIAVDASIVPTFHLTLVLRPEAEGLWPRVQKLFKGRGGGPPQNSSVRLGTGFRAIKRKLYSSAELLIEECC